VNAALIDTHTLLWLIDNNPKLSTPALARISEPGIELFFSHAGAWEIAIKFGLGKLQLPQPPQAYLDKHLTLNKIRYLPISIHAIFLAGTLPHHHGDPFDRLMVAQCLYADLPILSHDQKLDAYGVRRVW
jgi:PIN domain nuclease of toxin-antitoxin system